MVIHQKLVLPEAGSCTKWPFGSVSSLSINNETVSAHHEQPLGCWVSPLCIGSHLHHCWPLPDAFSSASNHGQPTLSLTRTQGPSIPSQQKLLQENEEVLSWVHIPGERARISYGEVSWRQWDLLVLLPQDQEELNNHIATRDSLQKRGKETLSRETLSDSNKESPPDSGLEDVLSHSYPDIFVSLFHSHPFPEVFFPKFPATQHLPTPYRAASS